MDSDDFELIARLYTRAGMIMEDASLVAVTASGFRPDDVQASLVELATASDRIVALVRPAAVVGGKAG